MLPCIPHIAMTWFCSVSVVRRRDSISLFQALVHFAVQFLLRGGIEFALLYIVPRLVPSPESWKVLDRCKLINVFIELPRPWSASDGAVLQGESGWWRLVYIRSRSQRYPDTTVCSTGFIPTQTSHARHVILTRRINKAEYFKCPYI